MTDVERFDALVDELRGIVLEGTSAAPGMDGYSASADALWKAAAAAFNAVASIVGATGFQASWAALRFYGDVMHIESPFMVLKLEDAVFPQYDLPAKVTAWLDEHRSWLAEEAKKHLDEYEANPVLSYTDDDGVEHAMPSAHPGVVAHWRNLVSAVLS